MGIRFNKSIKLNDLLKINISKSGISATVGKKGASVNIGTGGTFLNLSPTAVGIKGTGVSYRKKLGLGSLVGAAVSKLTGKEDKAEEEKSEAKVEQVENKVDSSVVEEYEKETTILMNLHKEAEQVLSKEEFDKLHREDENEATRALYEDSINGDEDTIESLVGTYLGHLDIGVDVKANYELEDHVLYVDLDLPEIEDLDDTYPCVVKDKVEYKKKAIALLKEEYAKLSMGLGVFLTAKFFNLSSYIEQIVMSAFTSERNKDGELTDTYLYSVKFNRDVFEKTDLKSVDDLYKFICEFENRINMSSAYSFKGIKPYEMESVVKTNSMIDEAIMGLKSLGYGSKDVESIVSKLNEMKFETSGEYLKEGLKLLQNK